MKEYNYLVKSYNNSGMLVYAASYVHKEEALFGIEVYQKSLPKRREVVLYEIKHWVMN